MAERKRRTPKTSASAPEKKLGKVIKDEVIYAEPSNKSSFIGAVLSGEIVDIIDTEYYSNGWIKIRKNIVNITGYVNRDSIV